MNTIKAITSFLQNIAIVGAVAILVYCVLKIMTGDESDSRRYIMRIKHSIIALILIMSITEISNLVVNNYFKNGNIDTNPVGFSSLDSYKSFSFSSIDVGDKYAKKEDKQGRLILSVDGVYYIRYKANVRVKFNKKCTLNVDILKYFDDCQGVTSGSFAQEIFYVYWEGGNNYLIPVSDKTNVTNADYIKENESYAVNSIHWI